MVQGQATQGSMPCHGVKRDGLEHLEQQAVQTPTVLVWLFTVLILKRCNNRRAQLHTTLLLRVGMESLEALRMARALGLVA